MVTLKEIALRFGCSVATVSKALNHMPDISQQTAKQIRSAAMEMGYLPNAAARTLKTNRSRIIGLVPCLREGNIWTHEYFCKLVTTIQAVMTANGYDISPINCNTSGKMENYRNHCYQRGYDGVITISADFALEPLLDLVSSNIPIVTIDSLFPNRSSIMSDHRQGLREIVQYVQQKGHRRIAFIHGEKSFFTQERLSSFFATCKELGIPVPAEYVKPALYHDYKTSANATRELMALDTPPTCIIFPDDYSTVGGRDVLLDMGLRIPEDISVVGYDGIFLANMLRPRLTTFQQDSEKLGYHAAEMLLRAIEKPHSYEPQTFVIPGRFVEGESVYDLSAATRG